MSRRNILQAEKNFEVQTVTTKNGREHTIRVRGPIIRNGPKNKPNKFVMKKKRVGEDLVLSVPVSVRYSRAIRTVKQAQRDGFVATIV